LKVLELGVDLKVESADQFISKLAAAAVVLYVGKLPSKDSSIPAAIVIGYSLRHCSQPHYVQWRHSDPQYSLNPHHDKMVTSVAAMRCQVTMAVTSYEGYYSSVALGSRNRSNKSGK